MSTKGKDPRKLQRSSLIEFREVMQRASGQRVTYWNIEIHGESHLATGRTRHEAILLAFNELEQAGYASIERVKD